jgi:two-component system response regulator
MKRDADVDVLLAEDNPGDAALILEALGKEGLADRVRHARDGKEALDFLFCRGPFAERAGERPPRLVILDLKLPRIDGLEVLRQVKRDARTCLIPVILLTSSNLEQDVVRGYRYGANSYVQKPVDFPLFQEAIRRLGVYWLTVNHPPPAATPTEDLIP